jgi:hypothetical protein
MAIPQIFTNSRHRGRQRLRLRVVLKPVHIPEAGIEIERRRVDFEVQVALLSLMERAE